MRDGKEDFIKFFTNTILLPLVKRGKNVDNKDFLIGLSEEENLDIASIMHEAAFHGYNTIIKFFLDAGLDIELKDEDGGTSLHHAVLGNKISTVKFLLDNNANINMLNDLKMNVLHAACQEAGPEMVDFLLENGANPNISSVDDITPLLAATCKNDERMVNSLLKYGAKTETSKNGKNAYDIASRRGYKEIVRSILDFKLFESIPFRILKNHNISKFEENICFPNKADSRIGPSNHNKERHLEAKIR